jgi:hypothetical protein
MLADVWQQLEGVTGVKVSIAKWSWGDLKTYPLSPVARTKFFHLGCSHISNAASAVSVHQHKCLLNSSLSVNFGKNVAIAFRILASEAFG